MKKRLDFIAIKAKRGSAIVGVLAAIVFIGIVVSFMLQNTKSHAKSSGSFGTVQNAQISVNNGMMATEGFFWNNDNDEREKVLNAYMQCRPNCATGSADYVFGSQSEKQQISGARQEFSSRIVQFNENKKVIEFEIKSGKNLRQGRAFYQMDEDDITIIPPPSNSYGATNSLYLKGSGENLNIGSKSNGPVTIEGDVTYNSDVPVTYGSDTYIGGKLTANNVNFAGNVYVGKEALINKSATFGKDAYFESSLNIGGASSFTGNVYVGTTINVNNSGGSTIDGDLVVNGGFQNNTGVKVGGNAYIRNGIKSSFGGNINSPITMTNAGEFIHSTTETEANIRSKVPNVSKVTADMNVPTASPPFKSNNKTVKTPSVDPQIDLSPISQQGITPIDAKNLTDGGTEFNLGKLQTAFNNAKPEDLYNGHLVVKMTSNINFKGPGGEFDGKVIFIIENGTLTGGGYGFFSNKGDGSTLLYLGPDKGNGKPNVSDFGTAGAFNGLIYIDEGNKSTNIFTWGPQAKINGALHNFSLPPAKFNWNATGEAHIDFEGGKKYLDRYSSLRKCWPSTAYPTQVSCPTCPECGTSDGPPTVVIPTDPITGKKKRVQLSPIGFYFH